MTHVLYFSVFAAVCVAVRAFPSAAQRVYTQHAQEQIHHLNYYLDNQDNYYGPVQKQDVNHIPNSAPARLETLEPDSEVELVPGVQPPQQPPQQQPVAPNIPGLLPGQRVFIVHMPIPGYRPGTIGGYQPFYIVAAGSQGNVGYPGTGFQNAVLVDPSGQPMSPVLGYQRGAAPASQHNPGFILGGSPTRSFDLGYHEFANPAPILQAVEGIRGIQLAQIALQGPANQGQRAPAGPGHQTNAGEAPNQSAGESEALLAPKDSSQSLKEDPSNAKVRSGATPRKLAIESN